MTRISGIIRLAVIVVPMLVYLFVLLRAPDQEDDSAARAARNGHGAA
jgi:hypothetical protein